MLLDLLTVNLKLGAAHKPLNLGIDKLCYAQEEQSYLLLNMSEILRLSQHRLNSNVTLHQDLYDLSDMKS